MPFRSFDDANVFHRAMRGVAGTKAGNEIWAKGVELYPGLTKERAWAGDRQTAAFVLKRP